MNCDFTYGALSFCHLIYSTYSRLLSFTIPGSQRLPRVHNNLRARWLGELAAPIEVIGTLHGHRYLLSDKIKT